MQTFLPYVNFQESAKVLDYRRLGKQRVEVLQLIKALNGETKAWAKHPAAKMWKGFENSLVLYGMYSCVEWRSRGYQDTCLQKILAFHDPTQHANNPPWLGNEEFHRAHRSNLSRKLLNHYSQYWNEPVDLEYIWPV